MRSVPLRLRLTLAFAIAMAALLGAMALFVYTRVGNALLSSVDQALRSQVVEMPGGQLRTIDPETGAILRTIESNRFVTGVTWVDGELWHGTWEGDAADIRQVDPQTGQVLTRLTMPDGAGVSGLESDQGDLFYAGGGESGHIRAVRRPRRARGR